jgi:hypothetical protein
MRGREAPGREALQASPMYAKSLEWLGRCERPPGLTLS